MMRKQQIDRRRRKADFWLKLLDALVIGGWAVFVLALLVFDLARPERDTGLVRYWGLNIRRSWAEPWVNWLQWLLWFNALITLFAITIQRFRARRKGDRKRLNLWLLFLLTVAWISYFFM